MHVMGVDMGFGYTKATNGHQFQVFKSVVGEAVSIQFADTLLPEQVPVARPPRHFEFGDERVFVGELAERQSRGRGFTLDPTLFIQQYAKTLALAAIAPYVEDGEPVRLVTGLPIGFFRKQKDELVTLLQNRHSLTIIDHDGKATPRQVYIERVRVVPQPFGSLFNLMLDDAGKVVTQRFATEKVGVIDIGFRTCDYTMADHTRYSERGSASSDSGMSMAYAAIANVLREQSGVSVEVYRLYEATQRGTIKIRGKRYDVKVLFDRAMTQLATRVAAEVNRLWADDWDIDTIILTGGGGAALAPHLQSLVEGEVLPLPPGRDARLNNVFGYWKFGRHIWAE
ncbi:MAG: ParM/StbA family protein [Nevskiaceae bacterium]|nr:MAG: ParM/StbA family protein [Nevskiaceae bacterium]TBR73091.1 MAG: ParM/StbA family protein [Nevskiaceae bacterium]